MENQSSGLKLHVDRERPVLNKHPWVFSGAIATTVGHDPQPGDIVELFDASGNWLARGYYNPRSQICLRILSWQESEVIDPDFWKRRLQRAAIRRDLASLEPETTAYRLVNAEADGLPGLIVDRYGNYLVIQCLTLGIDKRKTMIVDLLVDLFKPRGIMERSDVSIRKKEGLSKVVSHLAGEEPPKMVQISENGIKIEADLYQGHKTGLYLDQRENRQAVCKPTIVKNRDLLNVFAYTGGFGLNAATSGARQITNVEESQHFLNQIQHNLSLNQLDRRTDKYYSGDAFQLLRKIRDENQKFDVVILDPPKFAQNKRDIPAACRGYKDINLLALKILRPNGILATFSCSGLISQDLFQKVLHGAALDAGRNVQILQRMGQASDHPVLLSFPESYYLKGFLCRVE